jgi:hypothetical protein
MTVGQLREKIARVDPNTPVYVCLNVRIEVDGEKLSQTRFLALLDDSESADQTATGVNITLMLLELVRDKKEP